MITILAGLRQPFRAVRTSILMKFKVEPFTIKELGPVLIACSVFYLFSIEFHGGINFTSDFYTPSYTPKIHRIYKTAQEGNGL